MHCLFCSFRSSKAPSLFRQVQCLCCFHLHVRSTFPLYHRENRLIFLPYLLERWQGDFVIALQTKRKQVSTVSSEIRSLHLPPRVIIIIKPIKDTTQSFFINLLRNIAILTIRTTHFLVLDMDMWPSCTVVLDHHDPQRIVIMNSYLCLIRFWIRRRPQWFFPACLSRTTKRFYRTALPFWTVRWRRIEAWL